MRALLGVFAASLAAAAAAAAGLADRPEAARSGIVVVPGRTPQKATVEARPFATTSATDQVCIALASSTGSTDRLSGSPRCGLPSHVDLADRVYFGTYWQILDRMPETRAIVLGGGYANARVIRSGEDDFFAGIVDKADARGRVTDVILDFAGAKGGLDAIQGESILLGLPLNEATQATQLYDQLLTDPKYANARIHVTGHSLGAGYTEYVLAYALAAHGVAETDARADFLAFGAPNWTWSAARHFRIDPVLAAQRMVDFTAANDPVLVNGVYRIGINSYLPVFTGPPGLGVLVSPIAAHWPTTYASALGLPVWLSDADRAAATAAVNAQFQTGNAIDPAYGPSGGVGLTVDGSAGGEWLEGLGGADRITGGGGQDVLTGGAGADTFVFRQRADSGATAASADRITDLSPSEGDRIDLSAVALRLRFVGSAAFTGRGQVRAYVRGARTYVAVNLDNDLAPDMMIRLDGSVTLGDRDFVLG